ncbi:hypothetical protein, partial [Streptomyces sp. NPDC003832]
ASAPSPAASGTLAPTPSAEPSGPARPATDGQLLDGISFEQSAHALDQCLSYDAEHALGPSGDNPSPAEDYRIILAMKSTGDSNAPGDGMFVVAVKGSGADTTRLICNIRDGEAQGINISGGDNGPDAAVVVPDINAGKLYQQSVLDRGDWTLPFRWGVIGTVEPSVAKVTVDYGGETGPAALDHGWFVASGVLEQQVTTAPRVKGYDAGGKLVYDSDQDPAYAKTLP